MNVVLKYWPDEKNAGDVYSRLVAERFLGPVTAQATGDAYGATNVMLVGSLMHWCDRDTLVCGSGIISPDMGPPEPPRQVLAVRGPATRDELLKRGIEVPQCYGDPGVLANEFIDTGRPETHEYGVVLHYIHKSKRSRFDARLWKRRDDTLYIDIQQDPIAVLEQIQRCRTIISSSLHGLIFAHALGKKAVWVEFPGLVGGRFKFHDYFRSLGIDEEVLPTPIAGRADFAAFDRDARAHDLTHLQAMAKEGLANTREDLARR